MQEPYSPPVTTDQAVAAIVFHPELSTGERIALLGLMLDPGLSNTDAALALGVGRSTVYRAVKLADRLGLDLSPKASQGVPPEVNVQSQGVPPEVNASQHSAAPAPSGEEGCYVADLPPLRGGSSGVSTAPDSQSSAPPQRVPHRSLAVRVIQARRAAGFKGSPSIEKVAAVCADLIEQEFTEVEIVEWAPRVKAFTVGWVVNAANETKLAPRRTGGARHAARSDPASKAESAALAAAWSKEEALARLDLEG